MIDLDLGVLEMYMRTRNEVSMPRNLRAGTGHTDTAFALVTLTLTDDLDIRTWPRYSEDTLGIKAGQSLYIRDCRDTKSRSGGNWVMITRLSRGLIRYERCFFRRLGHVTTYETQCDLRQRRTHVPNAITSMKLARCAAKEWCTAGQLSSSGQLASSSACLSLFFVSCSFRTRRRARQLITLLH